ncbi:hypothetical protein [Streptomyces sp. ML-6]|uniref:hypothetical protein n=1 Tax=Streptomyces sp. ML-6 TaxID=2982693 RepID=UPI0024C01042|nr:hypothetical protein [Streptomyces sp. ML-6]MDK0523946.1 hypothetical protein [Streptomyces sp. ML-6]
MDGERAEGVLTHVVANRDAGGWGQLSPPVLHDVADRCGLRSAAQRSPYSVRRVSPNDARGVGSGVGGHAAQERAGPDTCVVEGLPLQLAQRFRYGRIVRPEQGADAFCPSKKRLGVAGGEEVGAEVAAGENAGALPFRRPAEAIELGAQEEGEQVPFRGGKIIDDTVNTAITVMGSGLGVCSGCGERGSD